MTQVTQDEFFQFLREQDIGYLEFLDKLASKRMKLPKKYAGRKGFLPVALAMWKDEWQVQVPKKVGSGEECVLQVFGVPEKATVTARFYAEGVVDQTKEFKPDGSGTRTCRWLLWNAGLENLNVSVTITATMFDAELVLTETMVVMPAELVLNVKASSDAVRAGSEVVVSVSIEEDASGGRVAWTLDVSNNRLAKGTVDLDENGVAQIKIGPPLAEEVDQGYPYTLRMVVKASVADAVSDEATVLMTVKPSREEERELQLAAADKLLADGYTNDRSFQNELRTLESLGFRSEVDDLRARILMARLESSRCMSRADIMDSLGSWFSLVELAPDCDRLVELLERVMDQARRFLAKAQFAVIVKAADLSRSPSPETIEAGLALARKHLGDPYMPTHLDVIVDVLDLITAHLRETAKEE